MADLHYTLQIALGWTDSHLHRFLIRGKPYGVSKIGGMRFADNPNQVRPGDFHFREKERFLYEYDFGDQWQHEIRVEKHLPLDPKKTYPVCIGGARLAPPEDCGGSWAFMAEEQQYSPWYIAERLLNILEQADREEYEEELRMLQYWLSVDQFSGHAVNRRLKQYAEGGEAWYWLEGEESL
jgi:hypothetical protein